MNSNSIKNLLVDFATRDFRSIFDHFWADKIPEDAEIVDVGDELLCNSEGLAGTIADILEHEFGIDYVNTGYYDPEEDERNGEVDEYTGWWYVTY